MSTEFLAPSRASVDERIPWLLCVLSVAVFAIPSSHVLHGLGKPAEFLALGLLVLAGFESAILRRSTGAGLANPGIVIAVAYLFMGVALWAIGTPETSVRGLLSQTEAVGVALYTIQHVRTHRQRSAVMGAILIGVTYSAFVGLLQHLTQTDLTRLLKLPGFSDVRLRDAQSAGVGVIRAGAVRAFGTFPGYGMFAVTCAVTVPLALHFARYGRHRSVRLISVLAACLLFAAAPTGVARAGILALSVALVVYARTFTRRQLGRAVLFFSAAVAVLFIVVPNTVHALVQTTAGSEYDPSVLARVEQFSLVEGVFRDNPFAGLGTGTWLSFKFPIYGPIDSQWLFAVADGGVLGLAVLVLLIATGIAGIPRSLKSESDPQARSLIYAVAAIVLGYLAASFSNDFLNVPQAAFLFFLVYGVLWGERETAVP